MDFLVGVLMGVVLAWFLLRTHPRKQGEIESPSEGLRVESARLQMDLKAARRRLRNLQPELERARLYDQGLADRERLENIVRALRPGHSPLCSFGIPNAAHPSVPCGCNCGTLNPEEAIEAGPCTTQA